MQTFAQLKAETVRSIPIRELYVRKSDKAVTYLSNKDRFAKKYYSFAETNDICIIFHTFATILQ